MQAAEEYEQKIAQVTESFYTRLKIMMEHTEDDATMLSIEEAFVKTGENIDDVDLHMRSDRLAGWLGYFLCFKSAGCNGMEWADPT